MPWLRRTFLAGFFVTVPLFITVVTLLWLFGVVDGLVAPVSQWLLGRQVPGLGVLTTGVVILLAGAIGTNVIGKRLVSRAENYLLRLPLFRTVYAPVRQLVIAFSPDNESGFKQVVMVEGKAGFMLGFLTKEFTVDHGKGPETFLAVYVPTNHLYLGDIVICERDRALFPDISVEDGIRVFLTGGMALPPQVRGRKV